MNRMNKLLYKLLVSFVLISIIPLLLVSWLSYSHSSSALNKKLTNHAEDVLKQKVNTLSLLLNDLQRMEHIIARNNTVAQFLNNKDPGRRYYQFFIQLDPIIEGLQTIRPENAGISIVSESDMVYFYGYSLNREQDDLLHYDWMPDISELGENPYITTVHDRPYTMKGSVNANLPVFSYVKRFWDPAVRTQGVLIIDFPVHVLGQLVTENGRNDASGTFIMDQQGHILYPQAPTELAEAYARHHSQPISLIRMPNGVDYQTFYKTEPLTGWTIVSYFSQKELYADIHNFRSIMITIVAISALLSLLASLYISYHIANPIMNLVKMMRNVEKGDLNQRITLKQRDEIGQLEVGFNRMVRNLRNLIDKVYEQQRMKRAAELAALQAQINPHFLYNALESINALARNNKQPEISKQIALLGKLLRFSISTFKEFVPLEQEINYVENYLLINKLRMKENEFGYTIQFPDSLLQLYTIKWILQPIVENAIIHGLEPKGRKGFIEIIGREQEDSVYIVVRDNGAGIEPGLLEQIRFQMEHDAEALTKYEKKVGLFNVQSRIRLHYGPDYGITIDSSVEQGTTVHLLLPRRTSSDEPAP